MLTAAYPGASTLTAAYPRASTFLSTLTAAYPGASTFLSTLIAAYPGPSTRMSLLTVRVSYSDSDAVVTFPSSSFDFRLRKDHSRESHNVVGSGVEECVRELFAKRANTDCGSCRFDHHTQVQHLKNRWYHVVWQLTEVCSRVTRIQNLSSSIMIA